MGIQRCVMVVVDAGPNNKSSYPARRLPTENLCWKEDLVTNVVSDHKTLAPFDGVLVTIRSEKSFAEVTKAIESRLQRFSIANLMAEVRHASHRDLLSHKRSPSHAWVTELSLQPGVYVVCTDILMTRWVRYH